MNNRIFTKYAKLIKIISVTTALSFCSLFAELPSPLSKTGLDVKNIPQFVLIGSDDNYGDGMPWVLDLLDSLAKKTVNTYVPQMSYFTNGTYLNNPDLMDWHIRAVASGHEVGNHTVQHKDLSTITDYKVIVAEITGNDSLFYGLKSIGFRGSNSNLKGLAFGSIKGFRFPFLGISNIAIQVLDSLKYDYDASFDIGQDGLFSAAQGIWPFRLNEGYIPQGVSYQAKNLWEIPVSPLFLPPNKELSAYGVDSNAVKKNNSKPVQVGLDWNLFDENGADSILNLAYLKYTFDKRLKGNRAPLSYGIHSNYYGDGSYAFRDHGSRFLLKSYLEYVSKFPEVRIVSHKQLLEWLKKPIGLDGKTLIAAQFSNESFSSVSGRKVTVKSQSPYTIRFVSLKGQILQNQNGQNNHEFLAPQSSQPLLAIVQSTSGAQNIHLILGE